MEKEDLTKLYSKKKWLQKSSSFLNQIIMKDMDDDDEDLSDKSSKSENETEESDEEESGFKFKLVPFNSTMQNMMKIEKKKILFKNFRK